MDEKIYKEAKLIFVNENLSITKIAEKLNINRKILSKKLKEDGLYSGKGYTDVQVDYAKKRIEQGITLTNICKEISVSRYGFVNHLKQIGVLELDESYTSDEYKFMIDEYISGVPSKQLLDKYNISEPKFLHILKLNNIKKQYRIYNFNETYFDFINTEEKAYWLGFLYADGYVGENTIELTLKESDYNHLAKFAKALDYDGPISYKKDVKAYRVSLCSQYLCDSLTKKGCMKAKSLILNFPTNDQVPTELIKHFIRGYIDGDGSIGIYLSNKTDKTKQFRCSILGTKDFLDNLYLILKKECFITKTKYSPHGKAWALNISGNKKNIKVMQFLYNNANIYLDRKYDIYLDFKMLIAQSSQLHTKVMML